ncbi:PVC-type heme-binding CxxCH protein [Cyclobacterium jeungdonense]|uniref:HEAT repeat domain-containing protein n=1 Tax=Cyclobacterium jeungdonense TaxID=708087 RepID=A0ABT8CCF3_9BACT|nr:PVC-type heme-binding CxxCH protein [Cyclobacterium jeungdonense]MDN3690066.1 HEAT repeat domain-containing protein [Cyclobacterium jeungdonense]
MKNSYPMLPIYDCSGIKPKKVVKRLFITLLLLCGGKDLLAQNALRDIPSPDPKIQMDMFQVADGFEVNLFASDPMVVKPIQMNWDEKGRLWVVSSTVYPHLKPGETANDKILVLEDSNGDGKADISTVFAEGLFTPTGILPGDGGVYVANSTEILHLKDTDGDGKADESQTILTGFGTGDTHHLIHTFRWGPDGLMYFNQSIYIYSHVETPWGIRRLEGGGVWQYNTKTRQLEVFSRGLINPWGLQFDKWGRAFLTDGAGTEGINHAFQGATFVTAPGADRILRGLNPGQPKHSGLDIVSGSHLPADWQGSLITNDFRANRINRFKLEERGSGFISTQEEDILWTDHIGFRPVDILQGPDGAIYVADWYNPIIQHGEVDFHDPRRDQQHGRIWRITKKNSPLVAKPHLDQMKIPALLEVLKAQESGTRLQAKLLLKSKSESAVIPELEKWLENLSPADPDYEHHLLEGLWVHQVMGSPSLPLLKKVLQARDPGARAAAIRILNQWRVHVPDHMQYLSQAITDNHPSVRLEAVVGLQNVNEAGSAALALNVLDQEMDTNLEFALWNTVKALSKNWLPMVLQNPDYFGDISKTVFALQTVSDPKAIALLGKLYEKDQIPESSRAQVIQTLARYGSERELAIIFANVLLPDTEKSEKLQALDALVQASQQRDLSPSNGGQGLELLLDSKEEEVVSKALLLAGTWKKVELRENVLRLINQGSQPLRKAALQALAQMGDEPSEQALYALATSTDKPKTQVLALIELAAAKPEVALPFAMDLWNQNIPEAAAGELFGAFMRTERGTMALTEKLKETKIPDPMALEGRKVMQRYIPWHRRNSPVAKELLSALEASGGVLPPERMPQQLDANQVYALAQEVKTKADPIIGESIYRRKSLMCQNCHALGGAGGRLGPDLSSLGTSSPIDNIIQSLLDPSESVKEGYELQRVNKTDGTVIMGYLISDGSEELIMRDMSGMETSLPKSQVASRENVPGSLMPPGLTASLEKDEFINLVGYLAKLGSSGDFRVTNEKFVRNWLAVTDSQEINKLPSKDKVGTSSFPPIKKGSLPLYSMVAGGLPVNEIPSFTTADGRKMGLVQFEVEILLEGKLSLQVNSAKGLMAWVSDELLIFENREASCQLPQGKHLVHVAIDLEERNQDVLQLKVIETGSNDSQNKLMVGN